MTTDTHEDRGSTAASRRAFVIALLGSCALIAAAAVVGVVSWVETDNLHVLPRHGAAIVSQKDLALGRTAYFNLGVTSGAVVTLLSADPAVVVNTSHSTLAVFLCTLGTGQTLGSGYSTHRYCSALRRFEPGPAWLAYGSPTKGGHKVALFLAVTPRTPGIVRIHGVRVRYLQGARSGDQQTGVDVHASTRRRS